MAETVSGGSPSKPPKEMSMELRLLLAFLLMGAVMFITPYFFKSNTPPPAKKTETAQKAPAPSEPQQPAPKAAEPAKVEPAAAAGAQAYGATQQPTLPPLVIETELYRITFSNQGATVRSWQLKKYRGNDNKPLEIINTAAGMEYPFALYLPGDQDLAKRVNWAHYVQTADPDGLGVAYEWSDGKSRVRKTFRFKKNSYLSEVQASVESGGKPVPSMVAWRGGFGDLTVQNPAANQRTVFFNVGENKLVEQTAKDASEGPVTTTGNYSFAGLADTYFAAVFLPENGGAVQQTTFSHSVRTPLEEKQNPFVGVAVSNGSENRFELFVGPKQVDLLRSVNPKLVELVNFGRWFGFLAKPLFLITNWLNNSYIRNYGWSIVVITVALNFLLFPLKLANMKSMKKMQALKPQIDAIGAKYKNVSLRDPRKAEQNQEVMALYKANGVNPMGGCFPMLIQLPFFIAFYNVFTVAAEMRGASWLWVTDLSQPEHLPIKILPLVMIASQFLMQKMTPQTTMDPNQQRIMLLMPLFFGFLFYNFPSGLVLYYLTSNLVSIGQQWFFNRTALADAAARSVEPLRKRNGRK